jgi:hypothetical protein
MQTNTDSNQKLESQEASTELLDKLHNNGVFGRSEYAKRDFWNDRFKEYRTILFFIKDPMDFLIGIWTGKI